MQKDPRVQVAPSSGEKKDTEAFKTSAVADYINYFYLSKMKLFSYLLSYLTFVNAADS